MTMTREKWGWRWFRSEQCCHTHKHTNTHSRGRQPWTEHLIL